MSFISWLVLCTVNLLEDEGLVLHFEKRGSDPYCEMRKDSVLQEKITVPSGTKARLSFLDCPSEDLRLTAVKTIGTITIHTLALHVLPPKHRNYYGQYLCHSHLSFLLEYICDKARTNGLCVLFII